jgi:NADH-quinone oxidoreductase subunit M
MNDPLPKIELLSLLFLPLAGAIVVALLGPNRQELVRRVSLGVTVVVLFLAILLAWRYVEEPVRSMTTAEQLPTFRPVFVPGSPGTITDALNRPQPNPHGTSWNLIPFGSAAIQFYIGLDGFNVWLIVLTAVLSLPSVLVSWRQINERVNEFYAWFLALQTAMMGIFLSFDIVLFYVFFEFSLVPLFFLIGIWGGPERRHAAGKFFIYTLTGSVITLLGVIGVVLACRAKSGELTFSIPRLVEIVHERLLYVPAERDYWLGVQGVVFLALMAGFAIKVPLVPFHTWLPLAHVEAPTAGSVDLAGVLLKVGAYGFLRLCVPLAPDVSLTMGLPLVSTLACIGIIYGAFCSYAQDDIKKMVAYSSVSHLGLCMLGMFALNPAGLTGSLMQMINHGLSTGAMFLLVGMLYERYHTRKISDFGGMAARLPLLGAFMVFVCLSSVGLPGLNGFIGEALSLFGVFEQQWLVQKQFPWYAIAGAAGMVLGAWYLFTMLQRVFFGELKEPPVVGHDSHEPITDLNLREILTVAPIMVLCLAIGVYPQPMLESMKPEVDSVSRIAQMARERGSPAPALSLRDDKQENRTP